MNDFDYDIMQMKRLASQAKYRKCGSKSKRCPMSTDYMTQKQWEKRCGEIVTYNMGTPMKWTEFRQLPKSIQEEYIKNLVAKYSVNQATFARMAGISQSALTKYCSANGLSTLFSKRTRMSSQQIEEFDKFILSACGSEIVPDQQENNSELNMDLQHLRIGPMNMTEFQICFAGRFDRDMIYNSIASILPDGVDVRIEIRCEILQ